MIKTAHKSGVLLPPTSSLPSSKRRAIGRKLKRLQQDQANAAARRGRELNALKEAHRRRLFTLLGAAGRQRYEHLRQQLAHAPRSKRLRESRHLLDEIGLSASRLARLQEAHLDDARRHAALTVPPRVAVLDGCSPWVTYTAPYGGYSWAYAWSRSDEPDNPVLARHLDPVTGRIGSSIRVRLDGADDDDFLSAEYTTALSVWHTALLDGPIEGYLAFEFRNSAYSGSVTDEFGFSDITYSQFARARLRVLGSQGPGDVQDSLMFNLIDVLWGDDTSWSRQVARPRDQHWYFFRTNAAFAQGSTLLLEAAIQNVTWFTANDESVTMADDLDLRLDRIMVRSCQA